MEIRKPAYYDDFHCLAGSCPDSCCKEWDVWVDPDTASFYRSLPGPLGDRLRSVLKEEDGVTVMTIEDGRCPMWRRDGLCRIHSELGEEALCDTCREFPRISHDFGDFVELQLELSCPEAARLILTSPDAPAELREVPGGEPGDYEPEEMEEMLALREALLRILADPALTPAQAILKLYRTGSGISVPPGAQPDLAALVAFYRELEVLNPQWHRRLEAAAPRPMDPMTRPLARYLLERYWLQYTGDGLMDTLGRITFIAAGCILVNALGGDFLQTAQAWSKEIENSDCNPGALMEAAYTEKAFSAANITALLWNS